MNADACGITELDASMELEDVFLHFFTKFRGLQSPRSVAEARITSDEVASLQQWFSRQYERPRIWCERTWQDKVDDGITASSREMLGVLFLILASEIYRDLGSEDSAWPTIAEAFTVNKKTHALLFVNQHPSELCKLALAAGVQKLKLRNLIESDGKQEYFDTLKLQVGFTLKGVTRRLPEWLDGFGCTTAIRILNGAVDNTSLVDLPSSSFQSLWKALREFRRGLRSRASVSAVLASSPWVRSAWALQILEVATLRLQRQTSVPQASTERADEPLCEPILQWDNHQARPSLSIRLNEDRVCEVLAGRDAAVFVIDGAVVGRWMAQSSGGFTGERQLVCKGSNGLPDLRPQCLTISCNGEPVETVDFADFKLTDPFLLFDLSALVLVDPNDNLEQTRDYALICDTDMEVPGIRPWRTKTRLAYRLDHPVTADIALICAGAVLWKPYLEHFQPRQSIRVCLESASGSIVQIGSSTALIIRDAPEDATAVSLFVGDRPISLFRSSTGWETERPVSISLRVVMRSERLRVRVQGPDYTQTVIPKLSLQLGGVAILKPSGDVPGGERWQLLRTGYLNRASGDGRAQIFYTGNFTLYEGFSKVDTGRAGIVNLRDLNGWGHPLIARSESDGAEVAVAESVEDRGCIDMYLPAGFGNETPTIRLRIPILPNIGHAAWVWEDINAAPRAFSSHEIIVENDGFTWKVPNCGTAVLVAVVFEGVCLGGWWSQDHILDSFRKPLSAGTVALMRWLKIPILNAAYAPSLKRVLASAPIEFLRGWIEPASLSATLKHRLAEDKLDSVVRALFWNYSERRPQYLNEMVRALGSRLPKEFSRSPIDNLRKTLLLIGEICPSIAYSLARADAHDRRYRECISSVVQDALESDSYGADRIAADLSMATGTCARMLRIAPDELLEGVKTYTAHLDGNGPPPQCESSLRRLGETGRGRHYMTAALLLDCLERVNSI
jgi:hypothetical protein